MAFKVRDPVRTEIVMDNRIIEQVKLFNCLGNTIFYVSKETRKEIHFVKLKRRRAENRVAVHEDCYMRRVIK